ncbi:MAG: alpha-L-rhamnosidase [Candidatus Sumerlaeia bacterium]
MKIERIALPQAEPKMDNNIQPQYEIQNAAWIWHGDCQIEDEVVLDFRNTIELPRRTELVIHVSADERYELEIDGEHVSMGPDRGDFLHWSFASYRVTLEKGEHLFQARVWRLGEKAPAAQISFRGGFILACEGKHGERLNTGNGFWRVKKVEGWDLEMGNNPHWLGASHVIHEESFRQAAKDYVKPVVVQAAISSNRWGIMKNCWRLTPSHLPEQTWDRIRVGKVRAVVPDGLLPGKPVKSEHMQNESVEAWQGLIDNQKEVRVPASRAVSVLIDLDEYYCAYPCMSLAGTGEVTISWAESLYELDKKGKPTRNKGNRNAIEGKIFTGLLDRFFHNSTRGHDYRGGWWRAGRYIMLHIQAGAKPFTIKDFHLIETRYPIENTGQFCSNSEALDATIPLMVRGMQMCMHETYMDCPYYEQLMYVGDTRLEMLTTYVMSHDERLPKRGIELYDWSRWIWGWVMEHYPSRTPQLCPSFALIWISLVRDYAWWRTDGDFVKERLVAVRGTLERFRDFIGESGLLEDLPGWKWCDWVDSWQTGVAPGAHTGISCLLNLFFVQALRHAADLEDALGDRILARRNRDLARDVSTAVGKVFWDEARGMLAEDQAHNHFIEHCQCLAILNDVLDEEQADTAFQGLIEADNLDRVSIYFSFYMFETLRKRGRSDLLLEKMDYWKDLAAKGFKTPVEQPEPSRSDCHAWGSHPLFHFHSTLCGVHPGDLHFRKVIIQPQPGGLEKLQCKTPHPDGWIEVDLRFDGDHCEGTVQIPKDLPGQFIWGENTVEIKDGKVVEIKVG